MINLFHDNKYTKWYFNIIIRAQSQFRIKNSTNYYENHHIIPKSFGGSNIQSNLILLTAKEHFICHLLLIKMCISFQYKQKMLKAFTRFFDERYHKTCKQYEIRKIQLKSYYKKYYSGINHPNYNSTLSNKQKLSISTYRKLSKGKYIWIHNNIHETRILKTELITYIENGYEKGRNKDTMKKVIENRPSISGNNNPMFGKSIYDVWETKFGKEIANIKIQEHSMKISEKGKQSWIKRKNNLNISR